MSKFLIKGGNKLSGRISVKGAKNSALKIIPAAILSESPLTITNLPDIEDVNKSLMLLEKIGAKIEKNQDQVSISTEKIESSNLSPEIAGKFRASIMFTGPLLAKTGKAIFPFPGGCNLASGAKRPINFFLDGFEKMGANITAHDNCYELTAKKLKGCEIFFPMISVTATESLMMTAILAEGKTILKNCAMEPEIAALADYLNSQGAKIDGAGTPTIKIHGVEKINAGTFKVVPDRIETGSFAIMAAATKSEITITDCNPAHIQVLLVIFEQIGVPFETGDDWIKIKKTKSIQAYSIKTHEYPGFPTDLQSPYTILMTQAMGTSLIHETIYDRRLLYTDMLMQMGADITMCDPHRVTVNGPTKLYGKNLASPDLRAGIALVIAAMIADGVTEIDNIYQIDRGYEKIDERLKSLGVDIQRIN
jgi:UDP-N-acetylglucosamine 1-carboxyvinyltransferase